MSYLQRTAFQTATQSKPQTTFHTPNPFKDCPGGRFKSFTPITRMSELPFVSGKLPGALCLSPAKSHSEFQLIHRQGSFSHCLFSSHIPKLQRKRKSERELPSPHFQLNKYNQMMGGENQRAKHSICIGNVQPRFSWVTHASHDHIITQPCH